MAAVPWRSQSPPGGDEQVILQLERTQSLSAPSSDLRAGLEGWACGTLETEDLQHVLGRVALAAFLLVPEPSAVRFPTFTCAREGRTRISAQTFRIKTRQERKRTQNNENLMASQCCS